MRHHINIRDIYDWEKEEDGLVLIRKFMEFGMLPKEGEFKCERCKQAMRLLLDQTVLDKYKWICLNNVSVRKQKRRRCRYSVSIRKNTFIEGSHLSLGQIATFICCWVDNMPLNVIRKHVRIAEHTSVDFGNFCREVVFDYLFSSSAPLGGPGKVVEIDESKFGRRKYNRGHRVEGQWVFGGFERQTGNIFMVPVEKRDKSTLLPIIKAWILPGTEIHSDFWKAYDCLNDEEYQHLKVNHSVEFVNSDNQACTNHIEASWRVAKKMCDVGGRRKRFFSGYLAKYMFLKRCRLQKIDPLIEFFKLAGLVYQPLLVQEGSVEDTSTEEYSEDDII